MPQRFFPALAVFLLGATVAAGQTAPAAQGKVISSVTLDINGDGIADRAVLVEGAEDSDLLIHLGKPGGAGFTLALEKKGLVWSGQAAGTIPSLEANARGSLLIKSLNIGIGRGHWEQTMTVVFRSGQFLIAGIDYSSYDTLDLKNGGVCALNLLTGNGKRTTLAGKDKAGRTISGLKPIPLAEWADDKMPPACIF